MAAPPPSVPAPHDANHEHPRSIRWGIRLLRTFHQLFLDLMAGTLTLQATSLAYITLLSLVPLLAVSFSVLKAFGVPNQVQPLLDSFLLPLGAARDVVTVQIIGFVENVKAGVLGSAGFALLFYTVVSLIRKIEGAFNVIWRVSDSRRLIQRFSQYLSAVMVGPVLLFSGMGIVTSLLKLEEVQWLIHQEAIGTLYLAIGYLLPLLMTTAAFALFYILIPNTQVKTSSALFGGFLAALLWKTIGWGFSFLVVTSKQYTAIYSAFAAPILFMIWLQVGWLILLIGASAAFYHQHPGNVTLGHADLPLAPQAQERLALFVMARISQAAYACRPAETAESLAWELGISCRATETILEILINRGVLTTTQGNATGYLAARPLDTMTTDEIVSTIRHAGWTPWEKRDPIAPFLDTSDLFPPTDPLTIKALGEKMAPKP